MGPPGAPSSQPQPRLVSTPLCFSTAPTPAVLVQKPGQVQGPSHPLHPAQCQARSYPCPHSQPGSLKDGPESPRSGSTFLPSLSDSLPGRERVWASLVALMRMTHVSGLVTANGLGKATLEGLQGQNRPAIQASNREPSPKGNKENPRNS